MPHSANTSSSSAQTPGHPTPASSCTPRTSASPVSLTPNRSSTSSPGSAGLKVKSKPTNIFSNDGSFLERFQRNKMEEQGKQKLGEELERLYKLPPTFSEPQHLAYLLTTPARKLTFENRFKNRGKRKLPPPEDDNEPDMNSSSGTSHTGSGITPTQEDQVAKKLKATEPISEYQQELRKYQGSKDGLSDAGTGVRPLVK